MLIFKYLNNKKKVLHETIDVHLYGLMSHISTTLLKRKLGSHERSSKVNETIES